MARPRVQHAPATVERVHRLKAEGQTCAAIAAATGLSERQVRTVLATPAAGTSHQALGALPTTAEALDEPARSRKQERYPKRPIMLGPHTVIDGEDLGRAMLPQDILLIIKHILDTSERDLAEAMALGADLLMSTSPTDPATATLGIPPERRESVARAAERITPSSIQAWRRRRRQMTWDELRVLLLGLREWELGPQVS